MCAMPRVYRRVQHQSRTRSVTVEPHRRLLASAGARRDPHLLRVRDTVPPSGRVRMAWARAWYSGSLRWEAPPSHEVRMGICSRTRPVQCNRRRVSMGRSQMIASAALRSAFANRVLCAAVCIRWVTRRALLQSSPRCHGTDGYIRSWFGRGIPDVVQSYACVR